MYMTSVADLPAYFVKKNKSKNKSVNIIMPHDGT